MADDLHKQHEDVEPILVQAAVFVLPQWVSADWPTEDEGGVADDQPVASTHHRAQSNLMMQLLERVLGNRQDRCLAGDVAVHSQHRYQHGVRAYGTS